MTSSVSGFLPFTEDKFVDENIKQLAEAVGIMRAVDDVTVVLLVEGGLCTEFAPEEFSGVGRRPAESAGHIGHVGDDSFDTISFSFDFSGQDGHAVPSSESADLASSAQRITYR